MSKSESDAEKCLEHFEDYDRREILCVSNRLVIFFTLRHTFKNIGRNTPFYVSLCLLLWRIWIIFKIKAEAIII